MLAYVRVFSLLFEPSGAYVVDNLRVAHAPRTKQNVLKECIVTDNSSNELFLSYYQ